MISKVRSVLQFDEITSLVNGVRALSYAAQLSTYHRIQGGNEIVEASLLVKEIIEDEGLADTVQYINVSGCPQLTSKGWFVEAPYGWKLDYAVVQVKTANGWKDVVSTRDNLLVVAVHSPSGVVEGIAGFNASHEAVITPELNYWSPSLKEKRDSRGAVIFSWSGPGYRYYGLFPPCNSPEPKAPALVLPQSKAEKLHGAKIRVEVAAKYTQHTMPVLRAVIGDGGEKRVIFIAHICHPSPGAHDNASGVSVLLETVRVLSKYKRVLRESGLSVEAWFVPEYTGSVHLVETVSLDNVIAGVSVDMVGAHLPHTGGRLLYVLSPLPLASHLDMYLYQSLLKAFDEIESIDLVGYQSGSDHDVLLSKGIPASMVNEWPDKYYHTNLDRPDNLSSDRLARITSATAYAVLRMATKGTDTERLVEWTRYIVLHHIMRYQSDPNDASILMKNVEQAIREKETKKDGLTLKRRGPISRPVLANMDPDSLLLRIKDWKVSGVVNYMIPVLLSATESKYLTRLYMRVRGYGKYGGYIETIAQLLSS